MLPKDVSLGARAASLLATPEGITIDNYADESMVRLGPNPNLTPKPNPNPIYADESMVRLA